MDVVLNPFSPGAGTPPPALVGRESILQRADTALARIKLDRSEKSALLVGLRGVGKTVLLRTISDRAEQNGYQAIFLETPEDQPLSEFNLTGCGEPSAVSQRKKLGAVRASTRYISCSTLNLLCYAHF